MGKDQISLLLADAHTLCRRGLARLLQTEPDFTVLAEAADAEQAFLLTVQLRPDLVLLDPVMEPPNGFRALERIRQEMPGVVVIVLTDSAADGDVMRAFQCGAQGYLLKQMEPEVLYRYIRAGARGEVALSGAIARGLVLGQAAAATAGEPLAEAQLSSREQEIVRLMATGATNREIAAALFLSEHTVKNYVKQILIKLRVHSRAQVVAWGVKVGLT